jgi:hypothetical protein
MMVLGLDSRSRLNRVFMLARPPRVLNDISSFSQNNSLCGSTCPWISAVCKMVISVGFPSPLDGALQEVKAAAAAMAKILNNLTVIYT